MLVDELASEWDAGKVHGRLSPESSPDHQGQTEGSRGAAGGRARRAYGQRRRSDGAAPQEPRRNWRTDVGPQSRWPEGECRQGCRREETEREETQADETGRLNDRCMLPNFRERRLRRLTPEERKSVTHGDFWIPDHEREIYRRALEALNAADIPYVVAGAYAIYEHTGIYRKTKDLDLFFEPSSVVPAARALRDAGFVTRLEDAHWLAKATIGEYIRRSDLRHGQWRGSDRCGVDSPQPRRHPCGNARADRARRGTDLAPAVHRRAASSRHVGRPPSDSLPWRDARLGASGPARRDPTGPSFWRSC